ncbi:MAG TPA: hypothetical protein VN736_11245 [Candidatus Limnocylindrales bacterium]|nr:hypothetical protein [Candidatus Limnocylindrales bacterium]
MRDHKLEADFDGLRLVLVSTAGHWQVFVYDVERCEVLHMAERSNLNSAKFAAVEYAAAHRFGPGNDLQPESIAEELPWADCA